VVKKRRVKQKERRKAIKKQLHYIQRNLGYIDELIALGAELESLTKDFGLGRRKQLDRQGKDSNVLFSI